MQSSSRTDQALRSRQLGHRTAEAAGVDVRSDELCPRCPGGPGTRSLEVAMGGDVGNS